MPKWIFQKTSGDQQGESLVSNEKIQFIYEITSKYNIGTLSLFLMSHLRKHETKNKIQKHDKSKMNKFLFGF